VFLTKRQSQLLDYLRKTIAVQGYAPSLEEMAAHFSLSSVGTVHKHLKALEEKGFIRRQWNRSRAIEIVDMPDGKARRIPLLGRLAEGRPIEALTNSDSIAVPEEFLSRSKAFVLEVKGEWLRSACIDDGDYVVIEQRDDPGDGDTVLAFVGGQLPALRLCRRDGNGIRLSAPHAGPESGILATNEVRVEGVVVGILRRLRS
jgi:repressor LexA